MAKYINFVLILFLSFNSLAQVVPSLQTIEEAEVFFNSSVSQEEKVYATIFLVDEYLDLEKMDTAQYWVNKGFEMYKERKPTFFKYLLQTRQSEVYYYNNLLNLGLESANKSLQIAKSINDSVCIVDAYNFTGLVYLAMDSFELAIQNCKNAAQYISNKEQSKKYPSITKPYHVYANLAEAYQKVGMYDSAITQINLSLRKLQNLPNTRALGVAYLTLGNIYNDINESDSALLYFSSALKQAQRMKNIDVALSCYSGKAAALLKKNDLKAAAIEIENGFMLYEKNGNIINSLFSKEFFKKALKVYQTKNDETGIIKTYKKIAFIDSLNLVSNAQQTQNVLKVSSNNENQLLKLEIEDTKRTQRLTNNRFLLALLGVVIMIGVFLIMRYIFKQKLKLAALKNNISQNLHDDVGASLSSVHIYTSLAEKLVDSDPEKAKMMLQNVKDNSQEVIDNISDMVWAMKPSTDSQSLEARIKNYGINLLNAKNIECKYDVDPNIEQYLKNVEAKKSIILIIKEAINNMAKYSNASIAKISVTISHKNLIVHIKDNGIGFDVEHQQMGNGIQNIRNRCIQLKAKCEIKSVLNEGTSIFCTIPYTSIRDTM
jgi:signal transduction histidine kinase